MKAKANQTAQISAVSQPDDRSVLFELRGEVCKVCDDVAGRAAIVQVLGMMGETFEAGGVDRDLDQDLWRGVESLMRQTRNGLARLRNLANGDSDDAAE